MRRVVVLGCVLLVGINWIFKLCLPAHMAVDVIVDIGLGFLH